MSDKNTGCLQKRKISSFMKLLKKSLKNSFSLIKLKKKRCTLLISKELIDSKKRIDSLLKNVRTGEYQNRRLKHLVKQLEAENEESK